MPPAVWSLPDLPIGIGAISKLSLSARYWADDPLGSLYIAYSLRSLKPLAMSATDCAPKSGGVTLCTCARSTSFFRPLMPSGVFQVYCVLSLLSGSAPSPMMKDHVLTRPGSTPRSLKMSRFIYIATGGTHSGHE